jgi:hypothetical protein
MTKFKELNILNSMVRKWIFVFYCLFAIPTFSQYDLANIGTSSENPFLYSSNQNEESLQYEREISNRLKKYIEPGKFLVIVDIKEHILPSDRNQPKSMKLDTGISVEFLPGLPFNPKMRKSIEVDIPLIPKKTYKHFVNVLLDTSLSPSIIPFAERLLLGSGLFNDRLGDELIIEFMEFPTQGRSFWDKNGQPSLGGSGPDELADKNASDQLVEKLGRVIDEKLGKDNSGAGDLQGDSKTVSFGWLEWIFIIGLLVMIVLTIIAMVQSKRINEDLKNQMHLGAEMQSNQIKNSLDKLQHIFGNSQNSVIRSESNTNASKKEEIEVIDTELSNDVNRIFLEDLETVMSSMREVLNGENEALIKDIAISIAVVNPALMGYLKPIINEDRYFALENEVLKARYSPIEQKNASLKSFRDNYILYRTNNVKKIRSNKSGDIFQFLRQLNNKQLFQLIKDESEDMSAILLAQIPAEQSVAVLSNFDIPKQTILLQRMSNINNVSTEMYKDVANKFSKKAMAIMDLGDVAVDGLASILNILETLPTAKQDNYIQDIAKYDLDLARRIKEHFLTFEGLLEVDSTKLGRALGEVSNPTIAKALIGSPTEFSAQILALKTQREREVIESEMAVNSNLTSEEIESNRVQLMSVIKEQIKR